ncbi:smp protein [Pseudoalteromonas sp. MMG013]|uniref:Membrane protein n=1 Tax=Pseudoalteromonas aurantia 208 TaxID=1314867 RepID=A0ABR9EEQ5_9GAMM|nr:MULTISPECIES: AhpA/YtjB family protein [Pseudoalteromonas]MBE0369462.1 membrane protein [Pseudoalteromonas aurantia 208]MBQ4844000.1 smp protein [Pseudoalteromonas sp. MMG005]MBQ4851519.1 smp protein [Pseudoalteromonas sp. MMG012]MBQ4861082.1 smp protein [Pseudoalteromonas sp. MMG013]
MKNTQAIELLKSSTGRRLVRLLIAAACFLLLTHIAFTTSFESHQLLHKQADNTARSLTAQLALNAAQPLKRNDLPALRQLANHLASDPFVMGVSIYNQQGKLKISNDGFTPRQPLNALPSALPGISKIKTPIVVQVIDNEKTPIGFVNTVYLTESAMSQSHQHFHELGRMVLLMLVITGVFTWQIGRALKRWEVKRQIRKSVQDES